MAKKKSGGSLGGFVFSVFNIGFTVFMFILPTIGLAYWYLYIRDPGGGVAPQPAVTVQPSPAVPTKRSHRERQQLAPANPQPTITSGFFDEPFGPTTDTSEHTSTTESRANPLARKEYQTRIWADESGKFSIQAKFYRVIGDRVKIVAENDRQIEVPIAKLSEDDKEYLRAIFRDKGIQPSF